MAIKALNPYVILNGTAEEAIKFYERVLGAKPAAILRMSEVPGAEIAPEHRNRIMHCELRIGDLVFMVSDTMPSMPVTAGDAAHIAVQFDDDNDLLQKYEALAAGGKPLYPPHDAFFGSKFGTLVDRFGVNWMFVGPEKKRA